MARHPAPDSEFASPTPGRVRYAVPACHRCGRGFRTWRERDEHARANVPCGAAAPREQPARRTSGTPARSGRVRL
ncbi:MAG: hypothetical protein OXE43_07445 [Chloroflexi bacterium]|nr:hypothetical protein [Chloroflexota bacterium]